MNTRVIVQHEPLMGKSSEETAVIKEKYNELARICLEYYIFCNPLHDCLLSDRLTVTAAMGSESLDASGLNDALTSNNVLREVKWSQEQTINGEMRLQFVVPINNNKAVEDTENKQRVKGSLSKFFLFLFVLFATILFFNTSTKSKQEFVDEIVGYFWNNENVLHNN